MPFNSRPLRASAVLADYWTGYPSAKVRAEDWGCLGSAAASGFIHTHSSLLMYLQPLPSCTKCIIRECAAPFFKMYAHTTDISSADAQVSGVIEVVGKVISARAQGGLAVGSITNGSTITVGSEGWEFPITIDPTEKPIHGFAGSEIPVCDSFSGCSTVVHIASVATGSAIANCLFGPIIPLGEEGCLGTASISQAKLFGACPNLTVTGTVVEGPCSGLMETFTH